MNNAPQKPKEDTETTAMDAWLKMSKGQKPHQYNAPGGRAPSSQPLDYEEPKSAEHSAALGYTQA